MPGTGEPELLAALRRLPHFAELTPELLSLVAARARLRTASRGDVLCRAGEPGEEFFLVIGGAVCIAVPSARGEEVVAELGAGEWFGEMALITGEPRSASAIAGTDAKLAVLARTDFLELVAQVPALGLAVSHVLSRRLRARLQGRPPRAAPSVVLAVTTAPNARNTTLVANLAAALAGESDCPLAFLDHAGGSSMAPAPGVKVLGNLPTDLTALRAAHRLALVRVSMTDARAPLFVKDADAVWALDVDDASGAVSAWVRSLAPAAPVTGISCEPLASPEQVNVTLDASVLEAAPLVQSAPRSSAARGLRGLARRLLGRRAGLALSAGGAKGLAHIGVLRCFERAGLEFDLIAGTSMGGIIGAFTAMGRESRALLRAFGPFVGDIRRTLLDFGLPEVSLLRGEKKRAAIREQVGERDIRDLALPFWTVAADLVSGREVVLGSGPLWQALDATSAIPGIFPPVAAGERLLIDGWVVNPIPVDVLRRQGADVVVAVDVAAGVDPTLKVDVASPPVAAAGGFQRLRQRLANPAIVRLVMRAMEVAARERTLANLALADACVQPDLVAYSVADFSRLPEIVERGEAAAEQALPAIRRALRRPVETSS
ncbi:MAG: cyclic nucleotide-binding domain-containing protein [Deltaproteobacteria bacterium]|nr:MAG: cyclic nucleotide-binding domain-containing protein [Deltaproteobacteria bacterium]